MQGLIKEVVDGDKELAFQNLSSFIHQQLLLFACASRCPGVSSRIGFVWDTGSVNRGHTYGQLWFAYERKHCHCPRSTFSGKKQTRSSKVSGSECYTSEGTKEREGRRGWFFPPGSNDSLGELHRHSSFRYACRSLGPCYIVSLYLYNLCL